MPYAMIETHAVQLPYFASEEIAIATSMCFTVARQQCWLWSTGKPTVALGSLLCHCAAASFQHNSSVLVRTEDPASRMFTGSLEVLGHYKRRLQLHCYILKHICMMGYWIPRDQRTAVVEKKLIL